MEAQNNTQDLHELVTLEPNNDIYTHPQSYSHVTGDVEHGSSSANQRAAERSEYGHGHAQRPPPHMELPSGLSSSGGKRPASQLEVASGSRVAEWLETKPDPAGKRPASQLEGGGLRKMATHTDYVTHSAASRAAANLNSQLPTSQPMTSPVIPHPTSIFSPGFRSHSSSPDPQQANSRTRPPFISVDAPASASSPVRPPPLSPASRLTPARKIPMHRVEKDSDDLDNSRRRKSYQPPSGTSIFTAADPITTPVVPTSEVTFHTKAKQALVYTRAMSSETASLPNHLHQRGLMEGRHSDITVTVFRKPYSLHRIILDRAPFFASALSEPWLEANQKEIELHPEEVDPSITQRTFELALKRLYGCNSKSEEDNEAIGLFATGCWLEMQDLIDTSVDCILRKMKAQTVAPMLHLVTSNYYGKAGDKILSSAKAVISRNGWQMPLRFWDGITSDLVKELISGDGFFVHGEWERWLLAKRLLDRRLKAAAKAAGLWDHGWPSVPDELTSQAIRPDMTFEFGDDTSSAHGGIDELERWINLYRQSSVEPLLMLLDEGVHYMHMDFEQLQSIRSARDLFGVPLMPEKIIADALWSGLELRQRVLNARGQELTLGLSQVAEEGEQQQDSSVPHETVQAGHKKRPEMRSTESLFNLGNSAAGDRRFWIPSTDCNIVIGGSSDHAITSPTNANRQVSRLSSALQAEDNSLWFHDLGPVDRTTETVQTTESRPTTYSAFPPFRFSAEFPNPRLLKERKRVYSRTVFYAGSLWNVYIQKVKSGSKSPQLGVYLHRAKERDNQSSLSGVPASVDERIGALERELIMRSQHRSFRQRTRNLQPDMEHAGQPVDVDDASSGADGELSHNMRRSLHTGLSTFMAPSSRRKQKSTARHSMPARGYGDDAAQPAAASGDAPAYFSSESGLALESDDSCSSDDTFDLFNEPSLHIRSTSSTLPPYTDARPTIKTYFKIYSPSKGGRTMSVYESAPDNFNFSQSWGWKSSSLMLEDEVEGERPGTGSHGASSAAYGMPSGMRAEPTVGGETDVFSSGVVAGETEGVVGGATLTGEDAAGRASRANLRFMVVLGVV